MNVERRKNKRLDLDVSIQLERLEVDDVVTVPTEVPLYV